MCINSTVLTLNSFYFSPPLKYTLSIHYLLTNEVLYRQSLALKLLMICHYIKLLWLAGFMDSWKPGVCLPFQLHIPSYL